MWPHPASGGVSWPVAILINCSGPDPSQGHQFGLETAASESKTAPE